MVPATYTRNPEMCVFPFSLSPSSPPFDLSAPVTDCRFSRATLYARTRGDMRLFLFLGSLSSPSGDVARAKD